MLEKTNGGDPRSASCETISGAIQGNPADGQHRDGDSAANFGEAIKPLGRAKRRFRWCGEDWAKKKIVGAAARRRFCSFERMAGNSDEEIFPFAALLDNPLGFRQRQTFFAKMDAARSLRERNIESIVHEDACCRSLAGGRFRGALQSFVRERTAVSAGEIFLANLDPIDASFRSGLDFAKESLQLFRRINFGEATPFGHVAKQRPTRGVIWAGHVQASGGNQSSRSPREYPGLRCRSPRRETMDAAQSA